jgi:divalent metal cation (Fe/Co/Zn/Cd) transporter
VRPVGEITTPADRRARSLPSLAPDAPDTAASCCNSCSHGRANQDEHWLHYARYARWLAWASLAWMIIEGAIGLVAGISAGSIALIGWALGSGIEGLASVIVIWRFTGQRTLSETAERRAQRAVAVSFWVLAPYIAVEAIRDLASHREATASLLGIALTASSLIIMPVLGIAKQRLAQRLHSGATAGEGIQNLMCAAQAAAVLSGLAVVAIWPAGWPIDPVIALGIAAWSLWQGHQSWQGSDCC